VTGKAKQTKLKKPIKVHKTANVAVQFASLFFVFHKHWVQIWAPRQINLTENFCVFSSVPPRHTTQKRYQRFLPDATN
jgi:hypothetical protein